MDGRDVEVVLAADDGLREASKFLDWGVLVDEHQGGATVYVVGLSADDGASLLREAADALDRNAP